MWGWLIYIFRVEITYFMRAHKIKCRKNSTEKKNRVDKKSVRIDEATRDTELISSDTP